MPNPAVGVTRFVVDPDSDEEMITTGNLWVEPADGELIIGPIVIYTLDLGRLRGMLDAARAGATNDDILLALDAAALTEPDEWEPDA